MNMVKNHFDGEQSIIRKHLERFHQSKIKSVWGDVINMNYEITFENGDVVMIGRISVERIETTQEPYEIFEREYRAVLPHLKKPPKEDT